MAGFYITNPSDNTVTPFADLAAGSPIAVGNGPQSVAFSPDGTTAYVTMYSDDVVTPIDAVTGEVGTPIPVGAGPIWAAFTPDGTKAYVANNGDNTVSVINVASATVTSTVTVGTQPQAIVVTPDGTKAYVANNFDGTITPIDIATDSAGAPFALAGLISSLTITPDGTKAYAGLGDGTVQPVDIATDTPGTAIPVGENPVALAITPDGATLFTCNQNDNTVTPVDVASDTAGAAIDVGSFPSGIAITDDGGTAIVTNIGDITVTPIDVETMTPAAAVAVPGTGPYGIAFSALVPSAAPTPPQAGLSVATSDGPFELDPTWLRLDDMSAPRRLTNWSIDRGRSKELDKTETGSAKWSIVDRDGSFDPTVVGSLAADGGFDPMRQAIVNLRNPCTDEISTLFKGYIDELECAMDVGANRSDVTLSLVDGFGALTTLEMHPTDPPTFGTTPSVESADQIYFPPTDDDPPYNGDIGDGITAQEVNARIHRALDEAGWPRAWRRIASGNIYLQGAVYERFDQLLSVIFDSAEAEFPGGVANAYMSKDGIVCFHGRYIRFNAEEFLADDDASRRSGHPLVLWKAGGKSAADADPDVALIAGLTFGRASNDILNAVTCLPQNVDAADVPDALVKDDDSIDVYGWRAASYEDLLVLQGVTSGKTAVEETKDYSNYYVQNYKAPKTRVTQLVFRPRDPRSFSGPATWALMCGIDIGDPIDLETSHWGGAGGFNERYFVEGIHYQADNTGRPDMPNITLTLDVSPASFWSFNPFA